MKHLMIMLTLGSLSTLVQADPRVLLVREYRSGFVPAAWTRSDRCEVSARETRIFRTFNGVKSTETRAIVLTDVEELLQKAYQGKISSESGSVDSPTQIYYGYLEQAKGDPIRVDLYEENGEVGQVKLNSSDSAAVLRQLLDVHCS